MSSARTCEIYSVPRKNSVFWKWRYTGADGHVNVCDEEYRLFLQCAAAARARGFEPRSDWTGPCTRIGA